VSSPPLFLIVIFAGKGAESLRRPAAVPAPIEKLRQHATATLQSICQGKDFQPEELFVSRVQRDLGLESTD